MNRDAELDPPNITMGSLSLFYCVSAVIVIMKNDSVDKIQVIFTSNFTLHSLILNDEALLWFTYFI